MTAATSSNYSKSDGGVSASVNGERDGASSKKIIGSSVVTSVSVILNGNEPEFTDALGHKVPKPQPSLQVASPIDLLNPDRYEFYTFDDNGDLVKRLMTMQEIQSIVANGDGDGPSIIHNASIDERDPEKNVQDIVDSVQDVLNKEVESNKNTTSDDLPALDTPDVSSSWSMILPAIFGNSGGDIFPQQKPQQIVMIPDSELLETSTKIPPLHSIKRPKPNKRKPGQKRKPTTVAPTTTSTAMTPQVVQEELDPHESVYTGIQKYQDVASNMQHFDGLTQLQMQPIYHKLPEYTKMDTTTRRVFVNNQEIIQSVTTNRPTTSTDAPVLDESYGKRPPVGHHKRPLVPNRHKTPNGGENSSTTKKPHGAHNKQKIKKKPTAATTTATTLPPTNPTTMPTTTTPEPPIITTTLTTTTTTTTTAAPTTTTTEPFTTTTTMKPSSTTPKKKKKKPTRQPEPSNGKPHQVSEKHKLPTSKPRPNGAPQHTPITQHSAANGSTYHTMHKYKPAANVPVEQTNNKPSTNASHKPHRTRPRPHKKPTLTTTTTTPEPTTTITTTPEPTTSTTSTTTPAPTTTTTAESTLIVEHFPGYHPIHVQPSHASKRPGAVGYPVPEYTPTEDELQETTESDSLHLKRKPLPSHAQNQQQVNKKPIPAPILSDHQHTMSSFNQIMQSLKQELTQEFDRDQAEAFASIKHTVTEKPPAFTESKVDVVSKKPVEAEEPLAESTHHTTTILANSVASTHYSGSSNEEAENGETAEDSTTTDTFSIDAGEMTTIPDMETRPLFNTKIRPPTLVTMSGNITKYSTIRPILMGTTEQEIAATTYNSEYETEDKESSTEPAKFSLIDNSSPQKASEEHLHGINFEPLYADVQEPIIIAITTTVPPDDGTTFGYTDYKDETTLTELVDELEPLMRLPVKKVETLTTEDESATEPPPQIADLKPLLNMGLLQPTGQINMSNFQTQAATVASMMLGSTNTIKPDISTGVNETRSEIDFLMSDVIQHLTDQEPVAYPAQLTEDSNRLTNFAQLNSSFLFKTSKPVLEQKQQTNDSEFYQGMAATTDGAPEIVTEVPKFELIKEPLSEKGSESTMEIDFTTEAITTAPKDLYKSEAKLDNLEKDCQRHTTTEAPTEVEFGITTLKITIPSLPQIYAITQKGDEEENLNQAENSRRPVLSYVDKDNSEESQNEQPQIGDLTSIPVIAPDRNIVAEKLSEGDSGEKQKIDLNSGEIISTEMGALDEQSSEREQVGDLVAEEENFNTTTEGYNSQTEGIMFEEIIQPLSTKEDSIHEAQNTFETPVQPLKNVEDESDKQSILFKEQNNDELNIQTENSQTDINKANKNETVENENKFNNKTPNEKEKSENDTYEIEQISNYSVKKDVAENETTEREESNQVAATTPAFTGITTEETAASTTDIDFTESLQNSTEKELTTEDDDSEMNAAQLQPQYVNDPATTNSASSGHQEYATEISESVMTIMPPKENSEDIKDINENEEGDVKSHSVPTLKEETEDSKITPANNLSEIIVSLLDEEETDEYEEEDPYIKLGESTTEYTEDLKQQDISADSTSTAEVIDTIPSNNTLDTRLQPIGLGDPTKSEEQQYTASSEEEYIKGLETQPPEVIKVELLKDVQPTPPKETKNETEPEGAKPTESESAKIIAPVVVKPSTNPTQIFVKHQHKQPPKLNYDHRPDPQTPIDIGDQTIYIIPKLPTDPVIGSLSTTTEIPTSSTIISTLRTTTNKPTAFTTKRIHTLKPVSYYNKQPGMNAPKPAEPTKVIPYSANTAQQRPMQRPPSLNNLMATSTQATRPPVKMEPSPMHSKGLQASTANLDDYLQSFVRLCNELAFSYWKSITSENISSARSLVMSPFALTSMLSMVFLGARGSTSGEMNEVLKLDDMVNFNPHLIFKNITDSVEHATDSDIATTAFVREIYSDRGNGKILQFFKEKAQQFYSAHVEEVNFHVVNDVIRRRTNLLVKRHTMGKVLEYLRTNNLWVNGPLATISANLFQTDCRHGSTQLSDGELFFQVHSSARQRRLVSIPAVLYKTGFTAGYEPKLDATVVAFGNVQDTVSTIYLMPGHRNTLSPAESLDRLERELVEQAFSREAWANILTSLMDRPGMEVQLPRFSHRSFINASLGLQKMGLKGLFNSDFADLSGLTGAANREIFLSDVIQINTFSTCGEEKIADHHHVEMYPAPPLHKRNKDLDASDESGYVSSEAAIDSGSVAHDSALGRGFYDELLDPKYLELPLSLRPRQARVPDAPRLRFDKPFLYFVRHNPTGVIILIGRFNPKLLP